MMTVKQVAEYREVHPQTIYMAIRRGKLKALKKGKHWLLEHLDVYAYEGLLYNRINTRDEKGNRIFDHKKGLYSPVQLANELAISPQRIYYLIRKRMIPFTRKGAAYVLDISGLDKSLI